LEAAVVATLGCSSDALDRIADQDEGDVRHGDATVEIQDEPAVDAVETINAGLWHVSVI
jgi:hypothetical protein